MKTTTFFNELKELVNCTLISSFDYSVDRNKSFYEIIIGSEPDEDVKNMCNNNGFGIKKNILHTNKEGKMESKTIWEVRPADANDIEYVEE